MSIGYRIFIVHFDNTIESISQKAFDKFYSHKEPCLKKYANSNIHVAKVTYALKERKPCQIIRIDNMRLTVDKDGSLDEERNFDAMRVALNRAFPTETHETVSGPVVDAKAKFDKRLSAQYHPELPGPAHKKILEKLFGKSSA